MSRPPAAPACVGNVAVSFDVLGHTLDGSGDHVSVRRVAARTIRVEAIRGERPGREGRRAGLMRVRDAVPLRALPAPG